MGCLGKLTDPLGRAAVAKGVMPFCAITVISVLTKLPEVPCRWRRQFCQWLIPRNGGVLCAIHPFQLEALGKQTLREDQERRVGTRYAVPIHSVDRNEFRAPGRPEECPTGEPVTGQDGAIYSARIVTVGVVAGQIALARALPNGSSHRRRCCKASRGHYRYITHLFV